MDPYQHNEQVPELRRIMEKAVHQARRQEPSPYAVSKAVYPRKRVESSSRYVETGAPGGQGKRRRGVARGAETKEDSEDETLIPQGNGKSKISHTSPRRNRNIKRAPCEPAHDMPPLASTSKVPYTPTPIRKPASPAKKAQRPQEFSIARKGKMPTPVKQEAEHEHDAEEQTLLLNRARGPASFYPSPSSPESRPLTIKARRVSVEIPVRPQRSSSPNKASQISGHLAVQVAQASRDELAFLRPKARARPKTEDSDNEITLLTESQGNLGKGVESHAVPPMGSHAAAPPLPASLPIAISPVARFLTQVCKPPLPVELQSSTMAIFENLGVKTKQDLAILAEPGDIQEFWMQNARKEGLSVLWEAVIRSSLKRLSDVQEV